MPGQDSQHAISRLDSWVNTILIGVCLGILLSFLLIVTDAYTDYRAHSQTREQLKAAHAADIDALMARADNALYRAKRDGRNRCALAAD